MDAKRLAFYGILGGATILAAVFSPATRSLFQGRSAPPPRAAGGVPTGTPATAAADVPRVREAELEAWRARHGALPRRNPFMTVAEEAERLRAATAPPPAPPLAPPLPSPVEVPLPDYRVRAILISDGIKVAAIDSRLVSEGDRLGPERVAEIRADAVVLEHGGVRRAIELAAPSIRIREEIVGVPARSPRP